MMNRTETMSVTLFTIDDCFFCESAKNQMTRKNILFEAKRLKASTGKAMVAQTTGSKTFPQIFVGDRFIGGYEQLKKCRLDEATDHRRKEISGEVEESMCKEDKSCDRFVLFNGSIEFEYSDVYSLYKKEIARF